MDFFNPSLSKQVTVKKQKISLDFSLKSGRAVCRWNLDLFFFLGFLSTYFTIPEKFRGGQNCIKFNNFRTAECYVYSDMENPVNGPRGHFLPDCGHF